jgi:hypothetical protein
VQHNPAAVVVANCYAAHLVAHVVVVNDRRTGHSSVFPATRDGKPFPVAPDNSLVWACPGDDGCLVGVTAFGGVARATQHGSQYYYDEILNADRAEVPTKKDVLILLAQRLIAPAGRATESGIRDFLSAVSAMGPPSRGRF